MDSRSRQMSVQKYATSSSVDAMAPSDSAVEPNSQKRNLVPVTIAVLGHRNEQIASVLWKRQLLGFEDQYK